MPEQGRVRERMQRPGRYRHHQHRIHDRVVMIGRDDERTTPGNLTDDLNAAVEKGQHRPKEPSDEAITEGRALHCGWDSSSTCIRVLSNSDSVESAPITPCKAAQSLAF